MEKKGLEIRANGCVQRESKTRQAIWTSGMGPKQKKLRHLQSSWINNINCTSKSYIYCLLNLCQTMLGTFMHCVI